MTFHEWKVLDDALDKYLSSKETSEIGETRLTQVKEWREQSYETVYEGYVVNGLDYLSDVPTPREVMWSMIHGLDLIGPNIIIFGEHETEDGRTVPTLWVDPNVLKEQLWEKVI